MRVKRGATKKQKHKKTLKQAKGYRMSYRKLYRRAKEALLHAGQYSSHHRRRRRAQKRKEWIKIISAALTAHDTKYSVFMGSLKAKNIELDRKNLAVMASEYPKEFEALVKQVA